MNAVARPSESPAKAGRNPVEAARIEELRKTLENPKAIETIRLVNMRKLIAAFKGPAMLARALDYGNASFLVQMAGPNPMRAITEKTARSYERALKLLPGWFDDPTSKIEVSYQDAPIPPLPATRVRAYSEDAPRPDAVLYNPATREVAAVEAKTPEPASAEQTTDIIRLCAKLIEDESVNIPLARFADLVELALSDTAEHGGQVRQDHMRRMVRLMK